MAEWLDLALLACAEGMPQRPVGRRGAERIDRAALLRRVDAWQLVFAQAAGGRWALMHDDAIEFAAALYGAWHAGKQVYLPADAQPATLARLQTQVDGFAGQLPGGLQAVEPAPVQPRHALQAASTQLVLYTSGSSGEPQAIAKSLQQLRAEIEVQHALHGASWMAGDGLQVWTTVSHQHIYGLLFGVLWPLAAGSYIVMPRISYLEELIAPEGPCLLVSSPAHLRRLPEDTVDWSAARRHLRAVLSSGGPLPPEAALAVARCLGEAPIEIYGSSETGGVAWRRRTQHGDHWNPLPQVELRVDHGQLSVRSPFLSGAGWFHTADRVQVQQDDSFVLLGRADRIVKIEERRVSLTALDQALLGSPLIGEARTLVLARHGGQRVAAVIVPSAAGRALLVDGGRAALARELRSGLRGQVDAVALPRFWRVVDTLPANTQGKVIEAALLDLFDQPAPWQWLERSADAARAQRQVEPGLAAFDGHFPAAPILPGVVQLDWVLAAAHEAFGLVRSRVRSLQALKFQQPVRPGVLLTLTLQWDAARQRLQFRIESAQGVHASGRVAGPAADV